MEKKKVEQMAFVYIWEFFVNQEQQEEFKKIYGANGDWVRLFQKAEGYVATDLHQDISNSFRFITVDLWESKADRDRFLNHFSKEYKALDDMCNKLTKQEKFIGEFDTDTNRSKQ